MWRGLGTAAPRSRTPLVVLAALLGLVVLVAVLAPGRRPVSQADCTAAPAAGRLWDFCAQPGIDASGNDLRRLSARNADLSGARLQRARLGKADLSYADLGAADLALADLSDARLLGASLRGVMLHHARLARADLRYADLTGAQLMGTDLRDARLDFAIWIDGRVCARHSLGACRALPR